MIYLRIHDRQVIPAQSIKLGYQLPAVAGERGVEVIFMFFHVWYLFRR